MAIFAVPARGVGRKDYSIAGEQLVEPVITSWQSLYSYQKKFTVPALGSKEVEIEIPLKQVVLIYDFMASIPSLKLIRFVVDSIASDLSEVNVLDEPGYQTVYVRISRGYTFLNIARLKLYNYSSEEETNMRVSLLGLYTSEEEYYLRLYEPIPL